jgi:radical SAM superfamily enzyme YgiQ (UPF0313 family)
MTQKDVLFLVSPMGTLWRSFPYIEPPYGASLVSANLLNQGWKVGFVDLELQLNHWQKKKLSLSSKTLELLEDWRQLIETLDHLPGDLKGLLKRMCDLIQPDRFRYVAFSLTRLTKKTKVYDVEFGFALALAWFIKSTHPCPVIFGGQVMSKIGRKQIEKGISGASHQCADFLFYEDGAVSLPLLLKALDSRADYKDLVDHLKKSAAAVTWWQEPGKIETLGRRSKPALGKAETRPKYNLERDLLDISPSFEAANASYYPVTVQQIFNVAAPSGWTSRPICIFPYKFMYGCSHRCAFCKGAYQPLIAKPVVDVVDDLQYYVEKKGAECFRFFNSQINYKQQYVEQFCNEIVRRNLKLNFIDSACLRNLNRDVCDMLREAGCVKLWFGLESPVPKILELIDKRLSLDDALAAITNADQAGIWIGMNIILGFPHETDTDFEHVCRFVEDYRDTVDCWNFSFLQLYGDTPMYDRPANYGIQVHHHYRGKMRDRGYAFSELGGLDWKARLEQSQKRVDQCHHMVDAVKNRFRSNDYLLFALFQEFGDKNPVKSHLNRFIGEMEKTISLKEGAKWITPSRVLDFDSQSFKKKIES